MAVLLVAETLFKYKKKFINSIRLVHDHTKNQGVGGNKLNMTQFYVDKKMCPFMTVKSSLCLVYFMIFYCNETIELGSKLFQLV